MTDIHDAQSHRLHIGWDVPLRVSDRVRRQVDEAERRLRYAVYVVAPWRSPNYEDWMFRTDVASTYVRVDDSVGAPSTFLSAHTINAYWDRMRQVARFVRRLADHQPALRDVVAQVVLTGQNTADRIVQKADEFKERVKAIPEETTQARLDDAVLGYLGNLLKAVEAIVKADQREIARLAYRVARLARDAGFYADSQQDWRARVFEPGGG